ncbi:FAD-binding oxidoreductase [Diaphorobacter ruginosibacter]|uniref:FAD-binding oxidoreductase n=1 Tax=Diaphorobacter ruginosibacter TaxID=1715720 RepID=UPI0033408E92
MGMVNSWGRLGKPEHRLVPLAHGRDVGSSIAGSTPAIAFGNGRSYGDVCLNPGGTLWMTRGLDHLLDFDPSTGLLKCEAGVLLRDIQRLLAPRGWMLPVTPGTQLVTVGGAIANDVHGKNHHVFGSFGDSVRHIRLIRSDGEIVECGPDLRADWFAATVGGLGLTGIIAEAWIQLRPVEGPWMDTESIPYSDVSEFLSLSDRSEQEWEHTVSWIDCIGGSAGRGIFMRANHSSLKNAQELDKGSRRMPVEPPISLVNNWSLRVFNALYFHANKWKSGPGVAHYEKFFYPLDNLLEWNKMYGPRGFYQYQCVIPRASGQDAVERMLREISRSAEGSFLAVLKTFGDRPAPGMLSFPMPGITLALDFPNRGVRTEALFRRLDSIVREAGGRIYMAKDARMPRDIFEAGYPRFREFLAFRDKGISSAMSRRLMGS